MSLSEPLADAPDRWVDHGYHPLRVAAVVRETAEARSLVLEVPAELGEAFAYQSGQFCTFRVWVDGVPYVRCYSMSSSPAVDAELRVTVKRTPDGVVSNWMHDHVAPGDVLEVALPAGFFRLTDGGGDVVALSAGSGITPVLSLVKTALATTSRRVGLLYANRDGDAVIFGAELDALLAAHPSRFTLRHHLDVDHGFLTPQDARAFAGQFGGDAEFYVCGPPPFMEIVEGALLAAGREAGRIHIERFTPGEWAPEPPAPGGDTAGTRQVTIELDGRAESTEYRPGTTILQTARQLGLSPPFSCEAGSCATCMARLVEGTATMHVNNALTDDEVADGWVLTCQALPTSPLVRVDYDHEEG